MKKELLPLELTNQECQDIWSGLAEWQRRLDQLNNPKTAIAIDKLIRKIRAHIRKFK